MTVYPYDSARWRDRYGAACVQRDAWRKEAEILRAELDEARYLVGKLQARQEVIEKGYRGPESDSPIVRKLSDLDVSVVADALRILAYDLDNYANQDDWHRDELLMIADELTGATDDPVV